MEPNLRASIIQYITSAMGIMGSLFFAWGFIVALTIPTVVEDFNNKLFFYALIISQISMMLSYLFIRSAKHHFNKARTHHKQIKRKQ